MKIIIYGFLIFAICSIIGYFIEVTWVFLNSKKFINRGFLCGPWIPIYGIGAVLILFSLMQYYNDPVVVFIFGMIITSALEYFVSFLLEKLFSNRWWDYSDKPYNINGRICLRNSIAFGVLSLVIIYLIMPLLTLLFSLLEFKSWRVIALIIFIIFLLDTIYSVIIAYNLKNRTIIVEELKNEKIALIPVIFEKRLKESIENFKVFPSRLLKAFPTIEKDNHNSFELMKNYREQLKKTRKELKQKAKEKNHKKPKSKKKNKSKK